MVNTTVGAFFYDLTFIITNIRDIWIYDNKKLQST